MMTRRAAAAALALALLAAAAGAAHGALQPLRLRTVCLSCTQALSSSVFSPFSTCPGPGTQTLNRNATPPNKQNALEKTHNTTAGWPSNEPMPAPRAAQPTRDEIFAAIRRGEPQELLVTLQSPPGATARAHAAVKQQAFGKDSPAGKAGVTVKRDFESLPISLVAVPNGKALDALLADPRVASVSPNGRAYPMTPAGARAAGVAAGAGGMGAAAGTAGTAAAPAGAAVSGGVMPGGRGAPDAAAAARVTAGAGGTAKPVAMAAPAASGGASCSSASSTKGGV